MCDGQGQVPLIGDFTSSSTSRKIEVIKEMRERGLTVRKIMKILDLKSPAAVHYWVKKIPKKVDFEFIK